MSQRHQPMEMADAPIPSHHAIIHPRKIFSASIIGFDLMATPGHVLNVMECAANSCRTSQKLGGWSCDAIQGRDSGIDGLMWTPVVSARWLSVFWISGLCGITNKVVEINQPWQDSQGSFYARLVYRQFYVGSLLVASRFLFSRVCLSTVSLDLFQSMQHLHC